VIFVDSSFWIALSSGRDDRRGDALALHQRHSADRLMTSNHVRGETWTFINARYGHSAAVRFLDALASASRLRVEFVSEPLEREALRWLHRHDERAYSFVDATSFAVMRALRIGEALAFDGDFAAAGFVELRL